VAELDQDWLGGVAGRDLAEAGAGVRAGAGGGAAADGDVPIARIAENLVYRNEFVTVYDDPVTFADGGRGSYLRIVESDGCPGVAVLAVAGDKAALVRTYRYPVGTWEWGIPRGFAHGDDPEASARAELAEELGREPEHLARLARMTPNSGLLAGVVQLFIARYPEPVAEPLDRREIAEVRWVPLRTLRAVIAAGEITDGFTLAAVGCAACSGLFDDQSRADLELLGWRQRSLPG
jgi:8-oxo-dGTP pyrophosphatase MutT (NUDIX family)